MKRFSLIVLLFIGFSFSCLAQPEHRISFGLGWFNNECIKEIIREKEDVEYDFPEPFDKGDFKYTDKNMKSLPINLNFHYECSISQRWGFGFCLGYDRIRYHQESDYFTSIGEQTSPHGITYTLWDNHHTWERFYRHFLYIMPEATFYWFKNKYISLYSKAGICVGWEIQKTEVTVPDSVTTVNSDSKFYYHVSLVSLESGGRYLRGFVELGYGVQGILQYGVKYIPKGSNMFIKE
ncbi:MAG: hypothetical protein J6Y11_13115 [Paludibacteraceae bacterium]|nr:hypothetical protein [Paludibacteraceae bacterium]